MQKMNTGKESSTDSRKLRSKSMSTATSLERSPTVNLGKIQPQKILKVHVDPSNQKFFLCKLKPKRGRFGWKLGIYWLHRSCVVPEFLDSDIIKLELQKETQVEGQLGSKGQGFKTIMVDRLDHTLRDLNFNILQLPMNDQSSKSLQFEAKELDHLSRLSEGSDEEEDYKTSAVDETEIAVGSPTSDDEHPEFKEGHATNDSMLVNQHTMKDEFLGKRGLSKSQSSSMRGKRGYAVNEKKFMKTAMMQEELIESPMHQTKMKMEFQAIQEFDEIYPKTMSDLRHFEVIGVNGVTSFNDDKYYSVVLKHKREPTMRALRILTGAELSAILGSN
jgi:hypothetical protein